MPDSPTTVGLFGTNFPDSKSYDKKGEEECLNFKLVDKLKFKKQITLSRIKKLQLLEFNIFTRL